MELYGAVIPTADDELVDGLGLRALGPATWILRIKPDRQHVADAEQVECMADEQHVDDVGEHWILPHDRDGAEQVRRELDAPAPAELRHLRRLPSRDEIRQIINDLIKELEW